MVAETVEPLEVPGSEALVSNGDDVFAPTMLKAFRTEDVEPVKLTVMVSAESSLDAMA